MVTVCQFVSGQSLTKTKVESEFKSLGYVRGIYHYYLNLSNHVSASQSIVMKRDSLAKVYYGKINTIQRRSKKYLRLVDFAIAKKQLDDKKQVYPYNWAPKLTSEYSSSKLVTQLDLYKIIRYYLLEKKSGELPDLLDIPFYNKDRLMEQVPVVPMHLTDTQ